MILLLDNYDSFTYNLLDILLKEDIKCKVIRNDELDLKDIITLNPDAVLISPGPGRPSESGILMKLVRYYHDKIPLLGICLGHQAIAEFFGAELIYADQPMHGKTSIIQHYNHLMYEGIPEKSEMMRYHSLIIKGLPEELEVTSHTDQGEIMSFAHKLLPIWAVQYHPESILSIDGPKVILNWIKHFGLANKEI